MINEQERKKVVNRIAYLLRTRPFTFEYKIVKKPKGIKVVFEVTKEQMEAVISKMAKESNSTKVQ